MAGREDAEEKVLKESLEELQSHLKQLNHAHSLDPSNQGVTNLRTQCEQAIQLTKEKIFKLRKARLLRQVECGNYTTKDREGLSSSMNSAKRAKLGDPTTKVGMGLAAAADVPPSFCSPIVKNHQQNVVEAFTLTKSGEVKTTDNWQIEKQQLDGSKCEALYRMLDGSAYWLKATVFLYTTAKSQHLHGHCKEEEEDVRFKVVILTPLEKRSIPCNFFLNSVNGCKFGDAGCRRSHGYWKKRSEIRPINGGGGGGVEEEIVPGMRLKTSSSSVAVKECLARYKGDELWYPAMIKNKDDDDDDSSSSSSSEEEEDSDGMNKSHAFKRGLKSGLLDAKMQYFGRWQAHTSGFGMKILAKYGL
eukprot:jgi/Bigna1/130632/aug1.12_g5340